MFAKHILNSLDECYYRMLLGFEVFPETLKVCCICQSTHSIILTKYFLLYSILSAIYSRMQCTSIQCLLSIFSILWLSATAECSLGLKCFPETLNVCCILQASFSTNILHHTIASACHGCMYFLKTKTM